MSANRPPFALDVPGVGGFQVHRMTPRLRFKVEAAANTMLRGEDGKPVEGPLLQRAIRLIALMEAIVAEGPGDFALDDMDPADPEDLAKMLLIEEAYLAEDARFRGRPWPPRQADGA